MKKRRFPVLLVIGITLIALSLSLAVFYAVGSKNGEKSGELVLEKLDKLLPEMVNGIPENYTNPNMPVLQISGSDYVALIEIPAYGIRLPVADKWEGRDIDVCPARFYGSAYDNSLVIGGADTKKQFSFCDKIDNGAVVTVTDMTGACFTYKVVNVHRSDKAESEWLCNGEYDLTLFCRDALSMTYIAVRCNYAHGL